MTNTVTGSYRTNEAHTMRAYDRLPAAVRAALRDAVEDWVPLCPWCGANVDTNSTDNAKDRK